MTREEAIHKLKYLFFNAKALPNTEEALSMAIEALEQQPCEDAISLTKEAYSDLCLRASKADDLQRALDMEKGAYNALVKNIQCEDAISRQAAIDACLNGWNKDYKEIVEEIRTLPPVTPQPKMGRWIVNEWTFTSERPPENDDEVIAYDGADAFVAWYGVNGWHSTDNSFDPYVPIIAWKPINPPITEDKSNESCWKEYYKSKFMKKF